MNASVALAPACGCCAGVEVRTPSGIDNRPGLSAVAYRIGRHGDFLPSLQDRLSAADYPALAQLLTRESDDFSLALLDAFGCMADVLTFYQERIINESYLRTAGERRSLVELGRLIGYRLRPGAAAETYLAFEMETAPGAPEKLVLEPGVQVQSVPGPGEKPQTFETVESIEARPIWNALTPRLTKSFIPVTGSTDCYLSGVDLNLKPGDALLFVGDEVIQDGSTEHWDFRILAAVETDANAKRTHVSWQEGLGKPPYAVPAKNPQVHVFRRKAAVFGHNAPLWRSMSKEFKDAYEPPDPDAPGHSSEWPAFTISPNADAIDLDAPYAQIVPQSWVVLAKPDYRELYRVTRTEETSRAEFAIAAKVTRLSLSGENYSLFKERVRETTVFAVSEPLSLTTAPDNTPVADQQVVVSGGAAGLTAGRRLIVRGKDVADGVEHAEVVEINAVKGDTITFVRPLVHHYQRATATVHANVALATHGETVHQILGSGDASRSHQRFALKHAPLTFRGAENESGAAAALDVRVDGLAWHETPTLFDAEPNDRSYVLRLDDDGTAAVQFGDGRRGARLPSGRENVRAVYRKGLGRAGNVSAGQLSQLMTRPLGLKGAFNPSAAEGGSDPASAADARRNMPLGVRTLGRVVSVRDYEDFARAYTGIGKAHAAVLNLRAGRTIFITVAGDDGLPLASDSPTLTKLVGALRKYGDPFVRVATGPHVGVSFRVALRIKRHPDHLRDQVLADVDAALRATFSFEVRDFGQPVALSEIIAVASAVSGVVAVDLDRFYLQGSSITRNDRLPAALPYANASGQPIAAELLLLAAGPLDYLEEME